MSTATVSVITSTEVRSFGDRPVTSYERVQTFAVCAITNYRVNEARSPWFLVSRPSTIDVPDRMAATPGTGDSYAFTGTSTEVTRQIGNAVPVGVAQWLGQRAVTALTTTFGDLP